MDRASQLSSSIFSTWAKPTWRTGSAETSNNAGSNGMHRSQGKSTGGDAFRRESAAASCRESQTREGDVAETSACAPESENLSPATHAHAPAMHPAPLTHPVMQQVRDALRQSPHGELRQVVCHFHEGVLTLRGRVSSFYLKQLAQTAAQRVAGVEECVNRLEVVERRGR